jgi:prephenate dehydratase
MISPDSNSMRVAFQGEPGAFSEAAAFQLLGSSILTVPRPTFEAAFHAISDGVSDALLAPVENSLAGSVLRVFDLLLESRLSIVAETILPIQMQLIGLPGATLDGIRSVASHPMALAQCERLFATHQNWQRIPAEDTAGSVSEMIHRGDKSRAAIASRRAAEFYRGTILAENVQDNAENYTRFVLLVPESSAAQWVSPLAHKTSLAMSLAHRPGALLSFLQPFARHSANLLKIESRPIHGRPWEYQFFIDVEAADGSQLDLALSEARAATSELRILGRYAAASR